MSLHRVHINQCGSGTSIMVVGMVTGIIARWYQSTLNFVFFFFFHDIFTWRVHSCCWTNIFPARLLFWKRILIWFDLITCFVHATARVKIKLKLYVCIIELRTNVTIVAYSDTDNSYYWLHCPSLNANYETPHPLLTFATWNHLMLHCKTCLCWCSQKRLFVCACAIELSLQCYEWTLAKYGF